MTAAPPAPGTAVVRTFDEAAPLDRHTFLAELQQPAALRDAQLLAAAYDAAVKQLIGPNDIQREGKREFKKKSAWRKLASHFRLDVHCDQNDCRFMALPNGLDGEWVVVAKARATTPWGQVWEDVGACGSDEERGNRRITFADAVGTAMTRASNRAVSNLIAMGEVSAEEMQKEGEEAVVAAVDALLPIGKTPADGGFKGIRLGDIPTAYLLNMQAWLDDDAKRQKKYAKLLRAIDEVLSERGPEDAAAKEEAAATDPTQPPASPGAPTSAADSSTDTAAPASPGPSTTVADDPRSPVPPPQVRVRDAGKDTMSPVQVMLYTTAAEDPRLTPEEKLEAYRWLAERGTHATAPAAITRLEELVKARPMPKPADPADGLPFA
jgi:hypothetical protein